MHFILGSLLVYGPADWGHVSSYCNGQSQSPVNIDEDEVEDDVDDDSNALHVLHVQFSNANGRVSGNLTNNGHSPTLSVDKSQGIIFIS
jgi:carbonic anhydrase